MQSVATTEAGTCLERPVTSLQDPLDNPAVMHSRITTEAGVWLACPVTSLQDPLDIRYCSALCSSDLQLKLGYV